MERLGGGHSASAITANGLAYFVSDRGITTVIRPGKEFEVVAKNDLKESNDASSSFNVPAQYAISVASQFLRQVALFIRGHQHLFCIGASAK